MDDLMPFNEDFKKHLRDLLGAKDSWNKDEVYEVVMEAVNRTIAGYVTRRH